MTVRKFSNKEVVDSFNKNLLSSILSEIPKKITPKQQETVELQKKVTRTAFDEIFDYPIGQFDEILKTTLNK
jgi:soluble cytochrome b562